MATSMPAASICLARALIEQGRMRGDAQIGEIALELFDGRIIALVRDFVAPVGSAGKQEAAQVLQQNQIAHLALEFRRARGGDHRLEDLGLAMVAIERAGAAGNRESRKTCLAAAFQFLAGIGAECRGEKPQHAKRLLAAPLPPALRPASGRTAARRTVRSPAVARTRPSSPHLLFFSGLSYSETYICFLRRGASV